MRKGFKKKVKRLVVKVGSALLTRSVEGEGRFLDAIVFELIARQIDRLLNDGRKVVLVSSGAMAAGSMQLGTGAIPKRIQEKQAFAAVGQPHLMHHYEEVFRPKGRLVAQVLLTHEDLTHRKRYLNSRRTLQTLLELGAVPIVNENDTVAVEEIKVGDNDTLSAQVAALIDADLLVILTTVEGLLKDGKVIPEVRQINDEIYSLAGGPGSSIGIGGMVTKIDAAKLAGTMGIPTVIAPGLKPDILQKIIDGENVGTLFYPVAERLTKRKHWLAWTQKSCGEVVIDDGAVNAITKRGKSLLPTGVMEVRGEFERGDAVTVVSKSGTEIALGLTEYSSSELRKIKGCHSNEIECVLGYRHEDEVIHRDNMVLTEEINRCYTEGTSK